MVVNKTKEDKLLEIELKSILASISDLNNPDQTKDLNHFNTGTKKQEDKYTLEDQIAQVRHQLAESYKLFSAGHDTLAGLSFVGIESKFKQQSESIISYKTHFQENYGNTLLQIPNHFKSIPELNEFFRVITQLNKGFKIMNSNHKLMNDLNKNVSESIISNEQNVVQIKDELRKTGYGDLANM